jgi:predicted alpha/beta superfamily hydrolase
MFRTSLLSLFVISFAASATAAPPSIIPAGERHPLHSAILGDDRVIYVWTPESDDPSRRYPVLYLTDAPTEFDPTRSSVEFLANNAEIPEMIVVGVTNPDRTRDLYATQADFKWDALTIPFPNSGKADRFVDFFQRELIPWVEANYHTTPFRILAGTSAGGNFALHAMRTKPSLFQAVMVASPWLAWDDRKEAKALVSFFATTKTPVHALFFSDANEGPQMKFDIDSLSAALQARNDPSLRWASATYPNETHETTALKSYYDGLRMIFAGWSYPTDPQTHAFIGSLDKMRVYYERLGERLGMTVHPPEPLVNALGYQNLRVNKVDAALVAFRYNAEEYSQSPNTWDSLAEALDLAGKSDEALKSYQKAVAIAEAEHSAHLEGFRAHLARFADKLKSKQ